jgi:hypothetical protein
MFHCSCSTVKVIYFVNFYYYFIELYVQLDGLDSKMAYFSHAVSSFELSFFEFDVGVLSFCLL